jgi:hypothetical protein
MDASQIVHELMHRRTLRDAYFPGAALEVAELRGLLLRTGELNNQELADLTAANVEQYLQRLKDRDARFTYEVTFGGDRGPQQRPPRPGLMVSVTDQDKTIDVFARDVDALRLSPPQLNFSVKGAGVEKMRELLRTGRSQEFGPGEVANLSTDFSFLAGSDPIEPLKLQLGPSGSSQSIPFRVTFGDGSDAIVYDWMEFKVLRRGTEEMELVGSGGGPFRVRLTVGQGQGNVSIEEDFVNAEVRSVQKLVKAASALKTGEYFELYDLKQGKRAFRAKLFDVPDWDTRLQALVADAVFVADRYKVELRLPAVVTPTDAENLILLRDLANGEFTAQGEFSVTIVKGSENEAGLLQLLAGSDAAIRLEREGYEPIPQLFGVTIPTGPIVVEAKKARLKNCDQARDAFQRANLGDDVEFVFSPCDKMRFKLAQ